MLIGMGACWMTEVFPDTDTPDPICIKLAGRKGDGSRVSLLLHIRTHRRGVRVLNYKTYRY